MYLFVIFSVIFLVFTLTSSTYGIACHSCKESMNITDGNEKTGKRFPCINPPKNRKSISRSRSNICHTADPFWIPKEAGWTMQKLEGPRFGYWCVKLSYVENGTRVMVRTCTMPSLDFSASGCADHFDTAGLRKKARSCWCNTDYCNDEPGWDTVKPAKGDKDHVLPLYFETDFRRQPDGSMSSALHLCPDLVLALFFVVNCIFMKRFG